MGKFVVGPVSELPEGSRRSVRVGGRAIAVFNAGGRFFAVRDRCPHQGAPLSRGVLVGELTANEPGAYEFNAGRPHVRCPWHGWEYDLETGQSTYDPAHDRVRAYDVAVTPGCDVLAGAQRAAGPFTVETVKVSVENDYVVIET